MVLYVFEIRYDSKMAVPLARLHLMTIQPTHVFHSRKLNAINYTEEKLVSQKQRRTLTNFMLFIYLPGETQIA